MKMIIYLSYMTQNPYTLLGLERTATENDIKKAFRKLSMTCHPDRVDDNDPERTVKTMTFTQLTEAKETLLNPVLRQAYDRGGWDFVKHMKESQQVIDQRRIKCEPLIVENKLSLAQLYTGENVKLEIKVPIHNEDGTITETVFPMEFRAEVGKLVAQHEGIQKPDHIPGDILVVSSLEDCPFETRDYDLVYTVKLDLRDLLQGYAVVIPHPTGPKLIKGKYTSNDYDDIIIFPELGLPYPHRDGERGNLVVRFVVEIDSVCNLTPEVADAICRIIDQCAPRPELDSEAVDISSQGKSPSQTGLLDGLERLLNGGMNPGASRVMSVPMGGSNNGAQCPVQ